MCSNLITVYLCQFYLIFANFALYNYIFLMTCISRPSPLNEITEVLFLIVFHFYYSIVITFCLLKLIYSFPLIYADHFVIHI